MSAEGEEPPARLVNKRCCFVRENWIYRQWCLRMLEGAHMLCLMRCTLTLNVQYLEYPIAIRYRFLLFGVLIDVIWRNTADFRYPIEEYINCIFFSTNATNNCIFTT